MSLVAMCVLAVLVTCGVRGQSQETARSASLYEAIHSCRKGNFEARPDKTGEYCIICRCINGDWVCDKNLVPQKKCCVLFGELCDEIIQCEENEFQLNVRDDYCIECRCTNGSWECPRYLNYYECCQKDDKLCECEHGQRLIDVTKDGTGCFKCHCNHGFWECIEPIYYHGKCCEIFGLDKFCNYTCHDGKVDVIKEKDHCVVCVCEDRKWVCLNQLDKEKCCEKHNIHCEEECCVKRTMTVNLRKKNPSIINTVDGITVEELESSKDNPLCKHKKCQCAATALIKAQFNKIQPMFGCVKEPLCQKRILKIDLLLHDINVGHHTDIGDSITNNGFGGDDNTQQNDVEANGIGWDLHLYNSDKCSDPISSEVIHGVFSNTSTAVTIWISNDFIRVQTDNGIDEQRCKKDCLYALNGQSDTGPFGVPNEDVYIGLNRVVAGGRHGMGICQAKIRWVCPHNKDDWMDFVKQKKRIDTASATSARVL